MWVNYYLSPQNKNSYNKEKKLQIRLSDKYIKKIKILKFSAISTESSKKIILSFPMIYKKKLILNGWTQLRSYRGINLAQLVNHDIGGKILFVNQLS